MEQIPLSWLFGALAAMLVFSGVLLDRRDPP
jgi:hypothetical protein